MSTQVRSAGDWQVDVAAIAGSLVHEIKNPLSTLSLNAQLLLEEWKDASTPKEQRALNRLRVMSAEVGRLENILQSFLSFTERHALELKKGSLNDLLKELEEFIAPQARQKGVAVRLGLDPDLPEFPFDPGLTRQVFLNLVLNAIRAMESSGGGELILRTRTAERDGVQWGVGDVVDTGPGISEKHLPRIFDPYFSTRKDGTGLGLATCKRVTEEHGGSIEVETVKGKGSQFSVYLPVSPAVQEASTQSATS